MSTVVKPAAIKPISEAQLTEALDPKLTPVEALNILMDSRDFKSGQKVASSSTAPRTASTAHRVP